MTESSVAVECVSQLRCSTAPSLLPLTRRVDASERRPIVDEQAGADQFRAAVDRAGEQRHLQQTAQLVLVLQRSLGVHEAALVREGCVRADEHVVAA